MGRDCGDHVCKVKSAADACVQKCKKKCEAAPGDRYSTWNTCLTSCGAKNCENCWDTVGCGDCDFFKNETPSECVDGL